MRMTGATIVAAASLAAGMGFERLVLALSIVVSVTILTVSGRLEAEAAVAIYSALVGYLVGAGHEAAKTTTPPEE